MRCPNTECAHEMNDTDIKVILTEENYQKYQDRAFARAIEQHRDISWCPTPDCKYAFVYNKDFSETTPGGDAENGEQD